MKRMSLSVLPALGVLCSALIVGSCGESESKSGSTNSGSQGKVSKTPVSDSVKKQADAGPMAVLTGKISFKGKVPKARSVLKSKDPEVCGTGYREIVEYKVTDGLLDETVLFLDGKYEGAEWVLPEGGYVLTQEGCFFKPYIGILRDKAELKIVSKDDVLHNIHAYERVGRLGRARRDLFNFSQPRKDVRIQKIRPRRSQFIELTCDAHDFMAGWRFVAKNPYCTVAKGGRYRLEIPAGTHTVKVWHPMLGVQEMKIEVSAGEEKTVDFEYEYQK